MSDITPEARRYQRIFWLSALRHLPHHSAMVLAGKMRMPSVQQFLGRRPERQLRSARLAEFDDRALARYQQLVAQTTHWHGTGRYQYQGSGVVDVFDHIVTTGSLKPVADSYAVLLGGKETVSISATPHRMIARSYADTHGRGEHEAVRYGSSLWWVAYFYGMFYAKIFTRYGITTARNWRRWSEATKNSAGQRKWGKKVNRSAGYVWDVFGMGSDIAGNFPILFGIGGEREYLRLPNAFIAVEVRFDQALPLSQITHLEVPEQYIPLVRETLKRHGYDIPVVPLELGEAWAAKQPFDTLLNFR